MAFADVRYLTQDLRNRRSRVRILPRYVRQGDRHACRLVSRTVRDLVVGDEMRFADHGKHELEGIEEPWHLYALE